MLKFLQKAIPWFFAALLVVVGYTTGVKETNAKWDREVHSEYIKKDEAKRLQQSALSDIARKYQGDIEALEGSTDRVINDLRVDNKRLLVKVKASSQPSGPSGRCEFNGEAELDPESAKEIIQVTQRGDKWIEALQDTVRVLQGKLNDAQQPKEK